MLSYVKKFTETITAPRISNIFCISWQATELVLSNVNLKQYRSIVVHIILQVVFRIVIQVS